MLESGIKGTGSVTVVPENTAALMVCTHWSESSSPRFV